MPRHPIESPLPGTFYRRPSPESPAYVEVGSIVSAGDVIGLVEVMKQFSEVQAEVSGTIVTIEVDNETAVEPGQTLMIVESQG